MDDVLAHSNLHVNRNGLAVCYPSGKLVSSRNRILIYLLYDLDFLFSSKHQSNHPLDVIASFYYIIGVFETMSKSVNIFCD